MNTADATYQWYSGGAPIAGATSSTYTLRNSDTGNLIQVSMTYDDTAGRATTILSANTATVGGVDTNDPVSSEIPNQVILEDATTTVDVSGYFSDADPDAVLSYAIVAGVDNNGDGDFDDAGVDNNGDGDFTDAGVDNNGDGDFDDAGVDNNGDNDFDDAGVDANGDGDFTDDGDTLPDVAPDVAPDVLPDVASTYATINSTGVITASPVQSDVGSGQAIVTATDQDGTATSQTFYMNVTNVNDAFEMSSGTLSVFGDVYDGATLEAGSTDIVVTTYDAEVITSYNAAGSYDFSYVMLSWLVGSRTNGYDGQHRPSETPRIPDGRVHSCCMPLPISSLIHA